MPITRESDAGMWTDRDVGDDGGKDGSEQGSGAVSGGRRGCGVERELDDFRCFLWSHGSYAEAERGRRPEAESSPGLPTKWLIRYEQN